MGKLLAPHSSRKWQILKRDINKRFLVNQSKRSQILIGPFSAFTVGDRRLKLAAEFDTGDFDSIRLAAYLYNLDFGSVDNAGSCVFRVFKVTTPNWTEELLTTVTGTPTINNYFFADVNLSALSSAELDGDSTLMIEVVLTRLSRTFRDRIYVNHLGSYDSILRLRSDVRFLDLNKLDE
jgi:hypothetical protein